MVWKMIGIYAETKADTAFLMHSLKGMEVGKPPKNPPPGYYNKMWKKAAYTSENGGDIPIMERIIVIPSEMVRAALYTEASGYKQGKTTRPNGRKLMEHLRIENTEHPIYYKGKTITLQDIEDNDWIDKRYVKIGGSRILRWRPYIPAPHIIKIETIITHEDLWPETVKELFANIKMGDFRPPRGIFGKYHLNKFEVRE